MIQESIETKKEMHLEDETPLLCEHELSKTCRLCHSRILNEVAGGNRLCLRCRALLRAQSGTFSGALSQALGSYYYMYRHLDN